MDDKIEIDLQREAIRAAALDPNIIAIRVNLAHFTADIFREVGTKLMCSVTFLDRIGKAAHRHLVTEMTQQWRYQCYCGLGVNWYPAAQI